MSTNNQKKSPLREFLTSEDAFFVIPIAVFMLPLTVSLVYQLIQWVGENISDWLHHPWAKPVATVLALSTAVAIFGVRRKLLIVYAVLETGFGVIIVWLSAGEPSKDTKEALVGILTGVCVIGHGLLSTEKARKQLKERLATKPPDEWSPDQGFLR